jgi:hypothetical protein
MNGGRYVLVTFAFCLLSTSLASARHHHGLHSNGSASGTGPGGKAADHANVTGGGIAGVDNNGKNATDPPGPRSTGPSPTPGTGVVPENAAGRTQASRPVPRGINDSGIEGPIDTSITVNQGRTSHDPKNNKGGKDVGAAIADIRQRLLGKIGATSTPKTSSYQPHPLNHRPKFLAKGATGVMRNAIGAAIERGASVPHESSPSGTQGSAAAGWHATGPQGPSAVVGSISGLPNPGGASPSNSNLNALESNHSELGKTTIVIPSVHGSSINGTDWIRPGTGPVTLGGPARVAAGINGSNMRAKHP